ncbi:MAG: hypothetical protein WDZ84_13220 [Rhodovibrionaceae bacterium]
MTPISFKRHRFPPEVIQHAVWLYARFTLSFRDVEDLLAEHGIDVSNETVRRWFLKFGRLIANHDRGLRANNRDENAHQPVRRRERKQQRFKSPGSAQRFLSIHAAIYNAFYVQRHLLPRRFFKQFRADAFAAWNQSWLVA